MVEEAAHDLRLGIVSMGAEDENKSNDEALRRAMRTMLDFSEALHAAKSQQTETIKMRVVAGTDPDE
jgi:hypothetical protein